MCKLRYIALLRGINVGGKNKIKMIDLKNIFEALLFKNVKTYIQSGNVSFDYDSINTIKLSDHIEKNMGKKFIESLGFFVPIIIRTEEELKNIINNNPFADEPNIDLDKVHVTFMADIPQPDLVSILDIKTESNERFSINSREVYLYCPNGYGRTKLNNSMFEKKLNVTATTRNWKTINNIFSDI